MHFMIGANIANSLTTGMGRQMHGVGRALSARGHRVDYFFEDDLRIRMGHKGARLEFPVRLAAEITRRAGAAGEPPVALLHEPIGWPTALFARNRVRTVAMVHNCELKCWRLKVSLASQIGDHVRWTSRVLWPMTELSQAYLSLKCAHAVLCLSEEDRAYISGMVGVPAARIHRVDNGVEPNFLGLPLVQRRERDLLFLGSWLPHKGTLFLGRALQRLADRGVTGTLTLAGTSSTEGAIRATLPEAWRPRTEIIPYVSPDQLISLYQRHRIFVLPSVTEGIPLAMLEAMACGLCPVVSKVGGVRDVLSEGTTGLLVQPLDDVALAAALERALTSRQEVERIGAAAHATAQTYGWDRVAAQVETACRFQ